MGSTLLYLIVLLFPLDAFSLYPKPRITTYEEAFHGIARYILTCQVLSKNPNVTTMRILWTVNSQAINENYYDQEVTTNSNSTEMVSELTIKRVTCKDDAVFTCEVLGKTAGSTNESQSASVKIIVRKYAGKPSKLVFKPRFSGDKTFKFLCSGNVGKPMKNLEMFLQKAGGHIDRIYLPIGTSDRENQHDPPETCLTTQTITSTHKFLEDPNNFIVTCKVSGQPLSLSMKISVKAKRGLKNTTKTTAFVVYIAIPVGVLGILAMLGCYIWKKRNGPTRT